CPYPDYSISCASRGELARVSRRPARRGGRGPEFARCVEHQQECRVEGGHSWPWLSSPIVWGDRVFVTSVVSESKMEVPKKGLYFGGERLTPSKEDHRWMVYCLDWQTGKVVWEKEAHKGKPMSTAHSKNSYASETPVTD